MSLYRGVRSEAATAVVGAAVGAVVFLAMFAAPAPPGSLRPRILASMPACESRLQLPTPICHVYVIFLENEEASQAYNASYEHYLATRYAYAARYYSVEHYSFPNYVAATAGYVDNWVHPMAWRNIVSLFDNRSPVLSWSGFMQNMIYPCWRNGTSEYRVDHNPFIWYDNLYSNLTNCRAHDQSFAAWSTDAATGSLPNYALFAPNTTNDCWRYGLASCDQWLRGWLAPLINSSAYANSVYFVTYDEGWTNDTASTNGTVGGGHVYTAAIGPYACPGYVSTRPYNAYDLFTTTEWLLGLPHLGSPYQDTWAADPPMEDLFCFPTGSNARLPADGTTTGANSAPGARVSVGYREDVGASFERPRTVLPTTAEVDPPPRIPRSPARCGLRSASCPRSRDPS